MLFFLKHNIKYSLTYTYYINFDLKITNKKHKKANKNAIYLSLKFNVVKIQHIVKIIIL